MRIFCHLSGPKWLKVLESTALIALAAWVLFAYVYLWVQLSSGLGSADL